MYASYTIGGQCETNKGMQRRLNPSMIEVMKAEILKLLDVGVIYPITDSKWVVPIHVRLKRLESH